MTDREECTARAQRGLWQVVGILHGVEDVLAGLAHGMPDSPEEMLEGGWPGDVMLEVESAIRCAIGDDLWPMLDRLKRAATVTPADLLRAWEDSRKNRIN